ncbi:putative baseplate assembly protein [Streptomyces sp. NPDC000594]|uniref:putative baseplate assembly protein n=1 Tax=Streptomyces sp. NPDC000594 TaxID=3154261 RepID=UPI0033245D64
MTVPPPDLDDLTWAEMMAAVRRRIPAESDGRWTLHAPVDPGMTLLELFAYLLEQRLYWLDQVPDALVVAILRLLGTGGPEPARPAATVLRLATEGPEGEIPVVPRGTVFSRDPLGRIAFALDDEVAVVPLDPSAGVAVETDRDRTADLRSGRPVALLAADGRPARARFVLPLVKDLPAPGPLTLLVELETPAACVPSWLPGAVPGVPPPAEVTWSWFRPGEDRAGAFDRVEDGTAGLRRSGVVRLHPPREWTTRDRGLLLTTGAATFAAPPRLLGLELNVSAARHRERRTATGKELAGQIRSWLRLPGQRLVLPDAAGRLLTAELTLDGKPWRPVVDFTFGASGDRVFVVDREAGALVFGDGLTGHVPGPGGEVTVAYTLGGGRDGNGGLTGNWRPAAPEPDRPELTAANPVQAVGGTDPETVTGARQRVAGSLGEVTRAVTAEDVVTLARTTPGVAVARAHAAIGEHPGFPCTPVPGAVTVRIVPRVPRGGDPADEIAAPLPDPGALRAVADRLALTRLLTSEVFVRPPVYREVALRVDLAGAPADRARVAAVVAAALRRHLDPLTGGADGEGWPFGEPLRPSGLLRAAQRALGDLAEVAGVAIGLDGAAPDEDCRDVRIGPAELPVARSVRTCVVAVTGGEGLE